MTISRKDMIGYGLLVLLVNFILMLTKILVGWVGNSYALIADGIESASDIFTSLISWVGFHLSLRPPDHNHPYGHGKIESLAGIFSGAALIVAAGIIAFQSICEILTPHHSPAWFTLPVLVLVVIIKGFMARRISKLSEVLQSRALEGDAWHHRSDALTSAAAIVGISIALIGGPDFAAADDWAALIACTIIVFNGGKIIVRSIHENIDGQVNPEIMQAIKSNAKDVEGVLEIEKCFIRKSGSYYFAELHVQVDPDCTVEIGHHIGHQVKDRLQNKMPNLQDVVVHLEPFTKKSEQGALNSAPG